MGVFKATPYQKKVDDKTSDKSVFKATQYKTYDPEVITEWEQSNQKAIDILNKYNERVNSNGWLSSDDLASYRKALDSYISTSERLRGINKTFGKGYTDDEEKSWADTLSSLGKGYEDLSAFYTQFDSEDAFKVHLTQNEMASFDLEAGKLEIDDLQSKVNRYNAIVEEVQRIGREAIAKPGTNYTTVLEALEEERKSIGDIDELTSMLDEKKWYYDQASQIQKERKETEELAQLAKTPEASQGWAQYTADKQAAIDAEKKEKEDRTWWEEVLSWYGTSPDTTIPGWEIGQAVNDLREDDSYKQPNDKWSEDQKLTFGALYLKSKQEAFDYAIKVNNQINNAEKQEKLKPVQEFAKSNIFASTLGSILTAPLAGADYLSDAAQQIAWGTITQNSNPTPFEYGQAMQGSIASHLNTFGSIDERVPVIGGKGYGDLYSLGVSIAQTIITGKTLGNAGMLLSYIGQGAASGVDDALARGGTGEQALLYGLAVGIPEGLAEMMGIDHLFSLKSTDGIIKMLFKQAGAEGMEEGITSIISNIADNLIMKSKSNYNIAVNWYTMSGMSLEDAKKLAWKESIEGVAFDTLGGALSGATHAGIQAVGSSALSKLSENKQAIQTYGNGADLVTESLEINPNNAYAQRMQGKLDKGKSLSGGQITRLVKANDSTLRSQDITKIEPAVEARLIELGEKGDVKQLSKILAKQASGEQLTRSEKALLADSTYGQRVANELNPDNIESGRYSSAWAESIDTDKINADAYSRMVQDLNTEQVSSTVATKGIPATKNTSSVENATEGKIEASDSRITINKDGEDVEVKIDKIDSIDNGEMSVKLDNGETVSLSDVNIGGQMALVYQAASEMATRVGGFNVDTANVFVKGYDPSSGLAAAEYIHGFSDAYRFGRHGYPVSELDSSQFTSKLSVNQRSKAYNLGKIFSSESVAKIQKSIKKAEASSTKKKGRVYFDGRDAGKNLTEIQRASLKGLRVVAEALGVDIHVFESTVDKRGKRRGANGWYDPKDNSIHIDLYAGKKGDGIMLFTAAHELTHHIKAVSNAKFKLFADALFEEYGKHGKSVEELIEKKRELLEEQGRLKGKTEEEADDLAYEEVVADACEAMLVDSNAFESLSRKIHERDKGLWETIKDFITKLVARIKAAYKGLNPNSVEANYVRDMVDSAERLQKLWVDALLDASETGTFIGERNLNDFAGAMNENGEALFQYRAMEADEDTYRQMLSKWGKMSDEQINNLFATIDKAMDLIKDNLEILDYAWDVDIDDRAFSPVKPNSDKLYQVSLDFSTLCRKRLLQQMVVANLQEALKKPLSKEEGIAIRDALIALQEEGRQIEVACALCYVESARMKSPEQIKRFIENREKVIKEFFAGKSDGSIKEKIKQAEDDVRAKLHKENPNGILSKDGETRLNPLEAKLKQLPKKYADAIRDAKRAAKESYKPTAEEQKLIDVANGMTVSDFTTPEGLENLAKNYPRLFDAYTSYVRNATKSKGIEGDTWWRAGDSSNIGDVLIANMNRENGLRSQSWSDFQVIHILDYIASTIELATRNTKEQAYSKVPDYVELMGQTGVMINLSLIPTAKFNGTLDYDSVEGMDYKRALELRDKYHSTAGTICIGISNEQIKLLLGDITIDYVIPYHKSGMSKAVRKMMHIPTWDQYEEHQSEKKLSREDAKKQAKKYGVKLLSEDDPNYHKDTSFSDWFDIQVAQQIAKMENTNPSDNAKQKKYGVMYGGYMAMQNAANNYLKLCAERGLSPKFSHESADFTAEENYWKLLIDRKMVDNITGEVIEQQTIKPVFQESEVMRILNDEVARYPRVKADQEYAIRTVTEKMLSGEIKGGMSAKDIAKVLKKPVDNVTKVNILASSEDSKFSDSDLLYSLRDVEPVEPTSDKWQRTLSTEEVKARFPQLWDISADESEVRNPTQISGTVKSYRKVYDFLKAEGFNGTILDASSGLGYGTRAGIEEYGFNVDDIEPYPDKIYKPKYKDYSKLTKKYDVIISNAVLNVIPQDQRDALVVKMGELLKDGGRMFINVRGDDVKNASSKVAINEDLMEYYISQSGSYQKGFTKSELVAYLEDALGEGFTVKPISWFGKTSVIVTKSGIRYSDRFTYSPTFYSHMGKVIEGIRIEKMGAGGVVSYLKGKGVKDEEIKWSGIGAFLEGKKSVTKAELQEFVAGSQLQIEEILGDTRWKQYKLDGGTNYRELVFKMPNSSYSNRAMRGHWGQDAEGILVHARIQDFTVDGKKMLFIEELQSDWHNEGLAKGYTTPEYEDAVAVYEKLADDYTKKRQAFNKYVRSSEFRSDPDEVSKKKFDWLRSKMDAAEKRMQDAERDIEALKKKGMGDVADAPFKATYHEYVIKRLLRMAAEEGYDSIGWTPSLIQSDRWSEEYEKAYQIEYDQEMPKFLRKYGKKWGATVDKTQIGNRLVEGKDLTHYKMKLAEFEQGLAEAETESDRNYYEGRIEVTKQIIEDWEQMSSTYEIWVMPITDSMKESVLYEGQVLYSDRRADVSQISRELEEAYIEAKDVVSLADSYYERYGGSMNKSEFRYEFLQAMKTFLAKTSEAAGKAYTEVESIAEEIVSNPKNLGDLANEFENMQKYIRSVKLKVQDKDKGELVMREGFGEFRKRHMGKLNLANKGLSVDVFYEELQELYGKSYFPDMNSIGEQLMVMADIMDTPLSSLADVDYDLDGARTYTAQEIFGKLAEFLNEADQREQSAKAKSDTRYITYRNPDSFSNRSLLADALDSVAQNDIEREKLRQYKEKIDLLNAEQVKLQELREKIKELSFAKGPKDTEAIRSLQFEANQTANRINTYDRQLLTLESTKALKGVLDREKKLAYQRAERKGKEALGRARERARERAAETQRKLLDRFQESKRRAAEGREKTAMRHKIKDVVNELNQYLLNGTKNKHVPIELQKAVAEALDAVNMDTVGAEERIAKLQSEMMRAKTPEEAQAIAKTIEHIQEMGGNMEKKISRLKTAYDSIINSDDPLIANSHDEVISNTIDRVMQLVGDTPLRDMSLYQLEEVYDMYRMVLHSIRNANKAFKAKKSEEISVIANRVLEEIEKLGKKRIYRSKTSDAVSAFDWNNLKPVYAFERIGSASFTDVFDSVRAGEDTWAVDMDHAQGFREEQYKKYKYDSWDFNKKHKFTSTTGKNFELTLGQIMSLYAYAKRGDQAKDHLRNGGFVFDGLTEVKVKNKVGVSVTYQLKDATAYNLSEEILASIIGELTPEQIAFVDAMQDYLSTVMGDKGNEVSLELYGIKLFKEKNYFPLKSAPQFLERAREQAQGDVKIKNKGFTKETTPKAKNPIVLTSFMDVWAGHVNEMSMYHAFTLALEDFYRVFNYKTPASETMDSESVISFLENAHGAASVSYIDQLLKDLNGGARSDPRETIGKALMSRFKKTAVMGSLSVVVQQPTAIVRAMALVDAKHFGIAPITSGTIRAFNRKKHNELWAEVKKYAPVAIIKEMGYFDTGMGQSSVEWLKGEKTFMDKVDDALSKAPAVADELAWITIWEAVKRETLQNNPKLKANSEEFLKLCGERFTEVVTKTQVYDSTLAKSSNMRSKGTLMNMWTAFMAEPTTSINMVIDAFRKGDKKYAARVLGSVVGSVALNAALVSLIYAMRDDDEDETFAEKYLSRVTTEFLDGINPITYIPFAKDIWSVAQGFDIERADMSLITSLIDALQKTTKVLGKDTSNMDEDALAEHQKQVSEALWSIVDSISSLTGIPEKNIRRDIDGIINLFKTLGRDMDTTYRSLLDNIVEELQASTPVWNWFPGKSKGDKLYDAIVSGDTAYVERLKSGYKTESEYNSAIRKALRENDPRIKEAAEAFIDGDYTKYNALREEIVGEGIFSRQIVTDALKAEYNYLKQKAKESNN